MPTAKQNIQLSRLDGGIAFCVAALSFALYTRTLYPDLLPGDSGEFQTLAYLLAHTHPTGYDVYLVLARLFILLPIQSIAYRVNLFSAFMGGLTVGCVYLAGRLLSGKRSGGFFGAAVLTVSITFWSQAVIAEVYTAGSFFLVLILLCLLLWERSKRGFYLALAAALGVLSLGVHLTVALVAPAVVVYLLLSWKDWPRIWRPILAGLLTGVVLFAGIFLLIDRNTGPESYFKTTVRPGLSLWEMTPADVNSPWERWLWQYKVPQFKQFMFADIKNIMPKQAEAYWKALPDEFAWVTIIMAALGLVGSFVHRWRFGVLMVLALAGQYFFSFNYPIWDFYVFYIPSYALLAVLASTGVGLLLLAASRLPARFSTITQPVLGLGLVILALYPFLPGRVGQLKAGKLGFPNEQYPVHWTDEGYHGYISQIVSSLDQGAIVFTDWGNLFPLFYAAQIEQGRGDLQFLETYPQDEASGISQSEIELIEQNLGSHPIYFDTNPNGLTRAGYRLTRVWRGPVGYYKVVK
jgi:hypothetical protein